MILLNYFYYISSSTPGTLQIGFIWRMRIVCTCSKMSAESYPMISTTTFPFPSSKELIKFKKKKELELTNLAFTWKRLKKLVLGVYFIKLKHQFWHFKCQNMGVLYTSFWHLKMPLFSILNDNICSHYGIVNAKSVSWNFLRVKHHFWHETP